jgi:hypothetical protein
MFAEQDAILNLYESSSCNRREPLLRCAQVACSQWYTHTGQMIGGRLEAARLEHRQANAEALRTGAIHPDMTPLYCKVLKALMDPWDAEGGPEPQLEQQQQHAHKHAKPKRKRALGAGSQPVAQRCGIPLAPPMADPGLLAAA